MLTRPAPTNISLSDAADLISSRLFRIGFNPQIARHRGCDQMRSWSRGRLGYHA